MKSRIKYPRSEKVYLPGTIYPELRVGMRKVEQVPSTTFAGEEKVITPNPDIYIYDTSGPFSDPDIEIDLKKGLPRLREPWILHRNDVEQLPEITSEYGRMRRDDKSLDHLRFEHISLPYRAKRGKCCTQMYYAKQGIITPEMEYVDIQMAVPPVSRIAAQSEPIGESSAGIQARVIRARQVAKDRFRQYGWVCNAQASGKWLHANTSLKAMELVNRALSNHQLTLRGADRAMRLSWTLADLAGRVSPTEQDVHQGIEMRTRMT